MLRYYIRLAVRHLLRDKLHTVINIAGLAVAMAIVLLIASWIYNECSYERYNPNYDRIARIQVTYSPNGISYVSTATPVPLADKLRTRYGSDFTRLSRTWWIQERVLAFHDKQLKRKGNFMEPDGPAILALTMLKGSANALSDPSSVFLSASTAKALFGNTDPIGKILTIDIKMTASVRGVYQDLPDNSQFSDLQFIGSWQLFKNTHDFVQNAVGNWGYSIEEIYVELAPNSDPVQLSARIRNSITDQLGDKKDDGYHPQVAVEPMRRWHLYSEVATDDESPRRIQFVWLFGTIGAFVLLLACINFMNLSTARSERRAKEVGIRKTIGSGRRRLIAQFFGEALLMSLLSLIFAVVLVILARPFFEAFAGKKIGIQWNDPWLWLAAIGFCILTALLAGSYPAIYLSSFRPVSVLKNTATTSRQSTAFRRTLVVLQFTISVVLIIGTIVVFRQIAFAKDRPVGYNREGLLSFLLKNPADIQKLPVLRKELLRTGAVVETTRSSAAATDYGDYLAGYSWPRKNPSTLGEFATLAISRGYGQTIGWTVIRGRDFSADFATDSSAVVINETAASFMGMQNPIGEKITSWNGRQYTVIGVVKNVLAGSPYEPPFRTIYMPAEDFALNDYTWLFVRMKPGRSVADALSRIKTAFQSVLPNTLFDYQFVDEEYGKKFAAEERIGSLAATFALLALFVSGLGIFGMASFMAERRTKEIGIRKVLGASVFQLWQLLSKEFVALTGLSLLIAMPAGFYLMHQWLQRYPFHSGIPWWIFAATGAGVLAITLLTVSAQSIKAALANPVNSLRNE
ncbi:MAG TPA: FtsX-like permease family protein [Puia sp.]|jgi:ABC-type antimicrobial peptide transport system permease subunit|nr:FtsX-like permease family protein [Puia sp.]